MIRYALLGLVQGLTEFLPVSSSGHLVIGERLLGLHPPGVLLEAFLHLGTLGAVLWVFRADLAELALALTRRGTIERRKEIGFLIAGTIPGIAQALALLPGVSRSGVTISAGVSRRIEPSRAARFSFLLSIPALLGAALLSLWDASAGGGWSGDWGGIAVGTAVAFVVGILGVHALLAIVRRSRLWFFSIYCAGVGLTVLVLDLL
jgi:undecaprenyl-diphosphatase